MSDRAIWSPGCAPRSAATAARSPPSARTTWPRTWSRALAGRLPSVDWAAVDDVVLGCANQAGEDNRNVARMAVLLAGLPVEVPGTTVNRLCGSGLDAVAIAARAVRTGEADLVIAGGVESMTRAPLVHAQGRHGVVAHRRGVRHDDRVAVRQPGDARAVRHRRDAGDRRDRGRAARDRAGPTRTLFALRSQERAAKAIAAGRLAREIEPVPVPQRQGRSRASSTSTSTRARPRWRRWPPAAAVPGRHRHRRQLRPASTTAPPRCWWPPRRPCAATAWSRSPGSASAPSPGSPRRSWASVRCPRPRSCWPGRARRRRPGRDRAERGVRRAGPGRHSRRSGLPDDAEHVNPNGGAIALGHPLGASGARLALTAALELHDRGARRALATMCIGVGQGIAVLFEAPEVPWRSTPRKQGGIAGGD